MVLITFTIFYQALTLSFFIGFVVYAIIDRTNSRAFYNSVFHGSNNEIQEEYKKEAKFYYEKFKSCNDEEFTYAVKNIKEYSKAAQDAISIIIAQKKDTNEDSKNV